MVVLRFSGPVSNEQLNLTSIVYFHIHLHSLAFINLSFSYRASVHIKNARMSNLHSAQGTSNRVLL